ncbi:MAG: class I SAM-dependent methyltransferase [Chitinophagales bacterium]|nr:class I SAM-dependent methyltransferase [Chitinophagaceae bacterium]MCB9064481.1 class I SAM-dependent methyltransferase [Chitinophagales bacterium]
MMEKIKELFDSWAGTERGERMALGHDVLVNHILDRWKDDNIEYLFDAGCGNGRALSLAKMQGAKKLAGIDMSDKMIAEAQKNLPEADLKVGPMQDLSAWDNDTFSHIISIEAIYYLQDPLAALKEFRRVLKQDGKIAIAIDYYTESKASHVWKGALGFDITMLSETEWTDLFVQAGFIDVKASRIKRTEGIKTQDEFEPSSFFPSYELYEDYIASGALLLAN